MDEKTKLLRERGKKLQAILRIGKNGLTEPVLKEVIKQLLKKRLIKIKVLKPILEDKNVKDVAKELAAATGSEVISVIGFMIVLHKPSDSKNSLKKEEKKEDAK